MGHRSCILLSALTLTVAIASLVSSCLANARCGVLQAELRSTAAEVASLKTAR